MNQEQMMQIQMMEQESQQLSQQLELVEQNLKELEELKESLKELDKNETGEILANLGKRIYIPVKITEKKLIVEVGNKNYVKKSVQDTIKVVDEQIRKLGQGKIQLITALEELQAQADIMMESIQKERSEGHGNSKDHKDHKCEDCDCGHDHPCGDDCECEKDE